MSIEKKSWWGLIGAIRIVSVEILPTDKRGTGSGLKSVFSAFGITSGLLLNSSIIVNFGLGIAFIVFCLPLLINLPLVYKYLKETKGADLTKLK
ncbi:MAG: hypothetical protein ACTSRI_01140 [Promethearchaeota archaeon]